MRLGQSPAVTSTKRAGPGRKVGLFDLQAEGINQHIEAHPMRRSERFQEEKSQLHQNLPQVLQWHGGPVAANLVVI